MDVIDEVSKLGGATSRRTIVALCGARAVDRALRERRLLRDARGRYSLPDAHRGLRVANSVAGVLGYRSAAAYWGWEQKRERELPEVIVPRTRHVTRAQRSVFIPHYVDLTDIDVAPGMGLVTSKRRTLVDCFRNLPYEEALAIADSALRVGDVTAEELQEIAESTRGCGRRRIICVAEDATPKSANALESVARAYANTIPGLDVEAQLPLEIDDELTLHPDLGDSRLRVLTETEGLESHGTREALHQDCVRYNAFTVLGWLLARFTYWQVMDDARYVLDVLIGLTRLARSAQGSRKTNLSSA